MESAHPAAHEHQQEEHAQRQSEAAMFATQGKLQMKVKTLLRLKLYAPHREVTIVEAHLAGTDLAK